jgi:PAS domain S-box-containing protein
MRPVCGAGAHRSDYRQGDSIEHLPFLGSGGFLATGVGGVLLAAFAYVRYGHTRLGVASAVVGLATAMWLVPFSYMLDGDTAAEALRWAKVGYFGVPFIPPAVYLLACSVLGIQDRRRPVITATWLVGGAFCVWAQSTDRLVTGVREYAWGFYPTFDSRSIPFLVFASGVITLTVVEFLLAHARSDSRALRVRARWFLLASGLASAALLDFLPNFGVDVPPSGYLSVTACLAIVLLVIRHHRVAEYTPSFAAEEITRTMGDLLIVCDESGYIRVVNEATEKTLGRPRAELLGQSILVLAEEESQDADRLVSLRGEETVRDEEMTFRTSDGTPVDVSVSTSHLDDVAGTTLGTVIIARDIRSRKQLEEQLLQSQKMEAVGRLAGGVAHDFNNVLTVISGHVDLLSTSFGAEDPRKEDLRDIRSAAERATTLTRQLLTFSRSGVIEPVVLDPNEVLTDLEVMLRRIVGEDVTLETDLDPRVGLIRADRGQLEQLIMNLVVNAREAMPSGGRLCLRTRASTLADDAAALLEVADGGEGMDPDTQQRIFEPFFTTKAEGTGLGLATVYGIVQQAGGSMEVSSQPGRGTTFSIRLPVVRLRPEADDPATQRPKAGEETILLVEDEAMVRALARRVLERHGYRVLEAQAPDEARTIFDGPDGAEIDLLLSDVVMPGKSGPELAAELRALRPELNVLFMSGYTGTHLTQQGVLPTTTELLRKPFHPDALVTRIRRILDGRPAPGESLETPLVPQSGV